MHSCSILCSSWRLAVAGGPGLGRAVYTPSPSLSGQVSGGGDLCRQCHELSARLGTCLDHEERRCDYVSHEVQGLLNRVEYSNLTTLEDFAQVYRTVAKESSLVKTLISVFSR